MQVQKLPEIFNDSLLFSVIFEYLTIRDILNLILINREFKQLVEQYCKNLLKELKMKPSAQKSFIHQMQFYFNRCLRIVRADKNIESMEGVKEILKTITTINHPFKFEAIKNFEVGTTFTCQLSRDEKANIFKTVNLIKIYDESKEKKKQKNSKFFIPNYQTRNGVRSIHCKSDNAVLLKTNGQVVLLSGQKNNEQQIIASEETILWTIKIPVRKVINSYSFTIFILENNLSLKTIIFEVFGKLINDPDQLEHQPESIYVLARDMLTGKQLIINVPCSQIIDATVGSKYAYFISEKNQLYEADMQQIINSQLQFIKAKIFEPLKGISIVKIKNGYFYYIALQRNVEHLEEWDTERVVLWLKQIGFEAYIKIARVEKLDGRKLSTLQKKYMHNVLGMTKQNMQQKFLMCINEYLNKKSNNDKLWGWGKNESGQLGSSNAKIVWKPQKIRVTCLHQDQYIDSIFCGWYTTFIRTQKGRIYGTVMKKQKKRKCSQKQYEKEEQCIEKQKQKTVNEKHTHQQSISDEQDCNDVNYEKKQAKNKLKYNKDGNKKKKTGELYNSNQQKQKNNKKFQEEQNWFEFPLGKAFFMQTYKDILFVIQCSIQHIDQPLPNKKLRTAKAILDKILWSNLNKDQFKVGYVDKEMGLIETSTVNMQKFDVKQNKIKYFKKNDIVIWDRDNKIDNF